MQREAGSRTSKRCDNIKNAEGIEPQGNGRELDFVCPGGVSIPLLMSSISRIRKNIAPALRCGKAQGARCVGVLIAYRA